MQDTFIAVFSLAPETFENLCTPGVFRAVIPDLINLFYCLIKNKRVSSWQLLKICLRLFIGRKGIPEPPRKPGMK